MKNVNLLKNKIKKITTLMNVNICEGPISD